MSVFPHRSLLSDRFINDAFGLGPSVSMDWKETPEAHIFKLDLPGRAKEDVKLQVHDGRVLHVSAQSKDEEDSGEKRNHKWHCKERVSGGSIRREFRLPENAVVDEIKASMSDGVLVVTVPKDRSKKKKQHAKKRAVEIGGEGEDASGSAKGLSRFVCCKA